MIAKKLTEMGFLTMTDKDPEQRRRRSKKLGKGEWSRSTINRILRNSTYDGRWVYGKRKVTLHDGATVTMASEKRDEDDPNRITVPVPPILEPGVFELAQERIAENKRRAACRPTKRQYLLRGICFCARCGSRMTGYTRSNRNFGYYVCRHNYPQYYELRCRCKYLRKDKAETIVWDYICEALLDEDELFNQVQRRRDEARQVQKVLATNIAALDEMDKRERRKLDSLVDLYLDGGVTKEVYLKKKRRIEKAIEERDYERTDLKARLSTSGVLSEDDERELRDLREKIVTGLNGMDFAAKRQLLELLKVCVVWDDEASELTVSGIFGSKRGQILSNSS